MRFMICLQQRQHQWSMPVDLEHKSQSLGICCNICQVIISDRLWWLNTIINGKWSKIPLVYVSSLSLFTACTKMSLSQNRELGPPYLSSCLLLSSYYICLFFWWKHITSSLICQELSTSSFFWCWHLSLLFSGVIRQEGCRERSWDTKNEKSTRGVLSRILTELTVLCCIQSCPTLRSHRL